MIPQMDPKMVRMAMKKLGIKQEDIDASRVIIETQDKNIIINNPEVSKMDMQGDISFQIKGEIEEVPKEYNPSEEDIEIVMNQTKADKKRVIHNLKDNNGNIAKTIMELSE